MRAVEHVVQEFLERPSDQQKIVVNLGCGYDPLPFQWLAREPELCRNVRFVDVDYKALMLTKTEIIEATSRMRDLLTPQALPVDGYTVLNAAEYLAVGCDLRDIAGLSATIGSLTKPDECLVLCVAEVSVTYMKPDAADALIEWAAHLSSGKFFWSSTEQVYLTANAPIFPYHLSPSFYLCHSRRLMLLSQSVSVPLPYREWTCAPLASVQVC
jgi:tRNA wybutosine-synthesizing protein 4